MLNDKSMARLKGVDTRLVAVIGAAALSCPLEFQVTEGVRSLARQQMLFDAGKSRTLQSKHLFGHAVDIHVLVNGVANWDFKNYAVVNEHVQKAAAHFGVSVKWGGNFPTFKDGPHFEIVLKG